MSTPVICRTCRAVASVNRVTAGLRCACGSADVDLFDPGELGFHEFMGAAHGPGTGWTQSRPDPLKGWSEYAGEMPGPNPGWGHNPPETIPCSNCHGTGRSLREVCRACQGKGRRRPTTSVKPEPQVAKHPGQTRVPFMGRRKSGVQSPFDVAAPGRELVTPEKILRSTTPGYKGDAKDASEPMPNVSPHLKHRDDVRAAEHFSDSALRERRQMGYPMHEADCPKCGEAPTHLVNDYKDDAWWHCRNCGPLANIDRHPEIDPYNPPAGFKASPKQFSTTPPKSAAKEERGLVLPMFASVLSTNPGLSPREALGIVRTTVQKYAG